MPRIIGQHTVPTPDSKDVLSLCCNGSCVLARMTPIAAMAGTVNASNATNEVLQDMLMSGKDASWILTSAVIIFTMQTGFGLLEAGCVTHKSEVSIMMKNALDVVFGGVVYWAVGFAFSFGMAPGSNAFIGVGHWFATTSDDAMGFVYALFLFQLSFATTANTIVSGAMVERTKMLAYNIFSMVMMLIYCIPAHWVWAENGVFYQMGAIDIAGCGPVHLVGGATGLAATVIIGPRKDAFAPNRKGTLPSPVKAILGMFMLWWGWLRFNSGSVFIVSSNSQWKQAVRAAVNTIVSSMGGGLISTILSIIRSKFYSSPPYCVGTIINGVLGSLVSVTAICTLAEPWEAFIIGCVGAALTAGVELLLARLHVDDPVGVVPVHAACGFWGLIAVGLFIQAEDSLIPGQGGVFRSGQFYVLGIQTLTAATMVAWALVLATVSLKLIDVTVGLRVTEDAERVGADFIEHGVIHGISLSASQPTSALMRMTTALNDTGSQTACDWRQPRLDPGYDPDDPLVREVVQEVLRTLKYRRRRTNTVSRRHSDITVSRATPHPAPSSEDSGFETGFEIYI